MPVYERYSGQHVAERVKTAKGSEDDERLSALAADGADGWRLADRKAKKAKES
jgi:hypothetical protein